MKQTEYVGMTIMDLAELFPVVEIRGCLILLESNSLCLETRYTRGQIQLSSAGVLDGLSSLLSDLYKLTEDLLAFVLGWINSYTIRGRDIKGKSRLERHGNK
jgi:hypothetical protein